MKNALSVGVAACLLVLPALASGQGEAGSITGIVRDATGAVLPGVRVEAASPALIEKVRTVVSDGAGQYRIVELRPGTYTVTFTLPGFSTVRREGIELTTGFTATVNADLRVGDIAETITVSGQSPVLDLQTTKQVRVITREVLDSIPTAKTFNSVGALIPGIVLSQNSGTQITQDVGGQSGNDHMTMSIHGGRAQDQQIQYDGMSVASMLRADSVQSFIVDAPFQEFAIDFSGNSAEVETGGVRVNLIPKEGANQFSTRLFSNFSNDAMQGSNIDDALKQRGLLDANRQKLLWNANATFGGPVFRDRLWFFGAFTGMKIENYAGGTYANADVTAFTYVPVLSRQAVLDEWVLDEAIRLTWQVTPRNKIGAFYQNNMACQCHYGVGASGTGTSLTSPEAARFLHLYTPVYQVTWASPFTNRILFEAGFGYKPESSDWDLEPELGAMPLPHIRDDGIGRLFRAPSGGNVYYRSPVWTSRGSMSYVTGSHALKTGYTYMYGINENTTAHVGNVAYTTFNGRPTSVTYYGDPVTVDNRLMPNLGIYAQDQWTMNRLTASAGLRFDYLRAGYPDQTTPPTQYVPNARSFPGQVAVNWTDLSPRFGVAYDLFGNGKTALKGTVNRYVLQELIARAATLNPIGNNNMNLRQWTDRNLDFVVQGDPFNPAAHDELGPSTNRNWGRPVFSTTYDPEWAKGFGVRPYNWELSASIQHELMTRVAVNAAYFRRIYGNFSVTDNQALSPSDFTPYCVTVPVDPRLAKSGQQLCGLFDQFRNIGQIDNVVTSASNYGELSDRWNGVDFTVTARLPKVLLQGGVATGKGVTDNCSIVTRFPQVMWTAPAGSNTTSAVNSGPSTPAEYCHVEGPYLTQAKLLGSYTLPWDVQIAATYQNIPGRQLAANAVFTSRQVEGSLGRPLAAASTVTVNVVTPGTLYEERLNQVDLRFTKVLRVGQARVQGMLDLYNALNGNPVLVQINTYGSDGRSWLNPQAILPARASSERRSTSNR
jgi:Carboxypeptidase regulatory-like domain